MRRARLVGVVAIAIAVLVVCVNPTAAHAARRGYPLIVSVAISGTSGNYSVMVRGHGFGRSTVALPFVGDVSNFRISDDSAAGQEDWGFTGDAYVLRYMIWTPTKVEVSGLGARPGDPVVVALWNAVTGREATWSGSVPRVGSGSDLPSQILNLTNWKVTLPVNANGVADGAHDATEVEQPTLESFSDAYFASDPADDGVTFIAPIDGATTSNSHYPRSELREMNGSEEASWSTTKGTSTMVVTESVDAVPTVKQQVVFAQIHGSSDDVFEAEIKHSSTLGFALYANHNGSQWGSDLADHYALGSRFTLTVTASGGYIDVYYDGVLKVHHAKSSSGDYFKAGAYTQSNECTEAGLSSDCSSGKVDDHSVGQVTIYALSVTHTT